MEDAKAFYNLDEGSQDQKKYAEQALFDRIVSAQPNSILEVGCGDGHLVRELSDRLPSTNITGLEYSVDMINEKKDRSLNILHGDITDSSLIRDHLEKYDCVCSNYVFSELNQKQLKKAFQNSKLFLKPGGKLLFTMTDPRTRGEDKEFDGYKLDFEGRWYNYFQQDLPFNVLLWDGEKYADVGIRDYHNPLQVYQGLLQKANFKDIKIRDIKRETDDENFAVLFEAERSIYS